MNRNQVTKVPFHWLNSSPNSASALTINVYPAAFSRVLEIADAFDLYRVTKLKFRLHCTASEASAGYYPGVTDNLPTSMQDLGENIYSIYQIGGGGTPPTDWIKVPKTVLRGYQNWYKTVLGSVGTDTEIVGSIFIRGGASEVVRLEIRGEFEFTGAANTGATPAERRKALAARERERILRLLSSDTSILSAKVKADPPKTV